MNLSTIPEGQTVFIEIHDRLWLGTVTLKYDQDRTFQVLGLSAPESFAANEALFREVVGSFGPLTDPSALNVKPARIKVVTVDRATTFADFVSRFGSGLPADRLAIVNQLQPNSPLQPGQKIKVIEGTVRADTNAVAER